MPTTLIVLSILIFALALVGMAIGVILSNRCLRGSCGGMAGRQDAADNPRCDFCADSSPDCTAPTESGPDASGGELRL